MSSILKALKKVEAEKVSRSDAPVDIARDILRHSGRRPGTGFRVLLLTFVAIVAVAGVVVFLVSGIAEKRDSTLRTTTFGREGFSAAGDEDVQNSSAARDNSLELPAKIKASSDSNLPHEPSVIFEDYRSSPDGARSKPTALEKIPVLIVTGIAYQQDREGRLAVVNELPVMEGTLIEGARIEEILEDRVRFEKDGRTFEVGLGNPDEDPH